MLMKSLVVFLIFITGIVQAQNVKVLKSEQLTSLKDGEFIISAVSPDNKSILASFPGFKGLYVIDINLKKILRISDLPGAGYEPCFSDDGSRIFFRSDEFIGAKKYSSLSEYDLKTGKTTLIENKSRELTSPVMLNNQLNYSVEGNRRVRVVGSGIMKSASSGIYVLLENLKPVLYADGKRTQITPNGEGNYIWVSLSPDKTKLLYNFGGRGTFVSDLDGRIIADLGKFQAPHWLNNFIIIGMNDKDDGYRVLSSDIVYYSLVTRKLTNLTSTSDNIEMYPIPFADGDKVIYQTLKGELFIMYLNIK
jgi:Tol biopolymer transport system component